jgi:hypothetical protein
MNFFDLILEEDGKMPLQIVNLVNPESKDWSKFGYIVIVDRIKSRNASFFVCE